MNNNNVQKISSGNFLLLSFAYEIMPVKKNKKKNKVNDIQKTTTTTKIYRRKVMD